MPLKVALKILLLMALQPAISAAQAEENGCSGSWEVNVRDNSSLQQSSSGPVTWLQAEVVIEDQLRGCINHMLVGPGNSVQWWLESASQSLRIEPYDNRRNPLYIADDGRGWILPLKGAGTVHTFLLRVDHPQSTRPGLFQGIIQTELRARSGARPKMAQQSSLLDFVVEPYVAMYFNGETRGGAGSYFHVDMGELRSGEAHEFDMFINSNSDVVIELESKNRAHLVHAMDPSISIPYELSLDSRYIDLRMPQLLNVAWRQQGNWRVPLRINVPFVSSTARAGEYSDTISIDIYPRE